MIRHPESSTGVPIGMMVVLMLSVFAVSLGFGVVLPLLPNLIERLIGPGEDSAQVARSTGLLTGLYTRECFSSLRLGDICLTVTGGAASGVVAVAWPTASSRTR